MHQNAATAILREFEPQPLPKPSRPSVEFFANIHRRFGVEVDNLVGLNALTRPFAEQQLTVAEQFYESDDPTEFMEVNRTIMNVWLYDLVRGQQTEAQLRASYEAFTSCQKRDKLSFEEFIHLKQIVDNAVPPELEEVFRATLIYADLGKSTRMQEFMRTQRGREYADHDTLFSDVMLSDDTEAIEACMPSFLTFTKQEQAVIRALFASGFHLGQYQKLENLPVHLEGMHALPPQMRDMIMLNGLFDIGGAQGDRVQNGSITLTSSTFQTFLQARASVQSLDAGNSNARQEAEKAYEQYLTTRNEQYDYDLHTPEGRALARFVSMFRVMKPDEIAAVPQVFSQHVNANTQAIFMDALNQSGYQPADAWVEYGPAFARNIYKSLRSAGCSFEKAMSMSMTLLARVHHAARRAKKVATKSEQPLTIMAAPLAQAAENQWPRLLQERIAIKPMGDGQVIAVLEPVPSLTITERLPRLDHLHARPGTTLVVGVGGGSDCQFGRFAANNVLKLQRAPVVSYPGVAANDMDGVEPVGNAVFLATPDTTFATRRCFEPFAAEGGPCYIIAETKDLAAAYRIIAADIAAKTGQPVANVVTVDSGGDILAPGDERSRDHRSLLATAQFEADHNITNSHTLVLIPGVDAPNDMDTIAHTVGAQLYDVSPHAAAFKEMCERHGLPTADQRRYSQMLEIAYLALSAAENNEAHGLQPLQLPLSQVRGQRPRPAFAVTSQTMTQALVVANDRLRSHLWSIR